MKKFLTITSLSLLFSLFLSCGDKGQSKTQREKTQITESGRLIKFAQPENLSFIKAEKIGFSSLQSEMTFPARVSATTVASEEGAGKNIILFENPDLTANYMALVQHLININQIENVTIKQRKIELDRAKDLAANGAASGKEVLEAETALAMENANLNNEKASLIEHEAKLKLAGFEPKAILHAPAGKIWVVCDVPENMLNSLERGGICTVYFPSFQEKKFNGSIEAVGDVVDNITRMVKLRIALKNSDSKMKAGMFASVSFNQSVNNSLSISKQSIVTVQGKTYVFIKAGDMQFERKEISVGALMDDRAVILSGLKEGDEVITEGAMQLKGLSFGY